MMSYAVPSAALLAWLSPSMMIMQGQVFRYSAKHTGSKLMEKRWMLTLFNKSRFNNADNATTHDDDVGHDDRALL